MSTVEPLQQHCFLLKRLPHRRLLTNIDLSSIEKKNYCHQHSTTTNVGDARADVLRYVLRRNAAVYCLAISITEW